MKLAVKEDTSRLMDIWREAFGEDEFAGKFYDGCIDYNNIFVDRNEHNEVISALHLIPCSYINGNVRLDGAYLYALATDKKYRGQGFMGRLLRDIKEQAGVRGLNFLYLMPACDLLYDYYKKYDFEAIYINEIADSPSITKVTKAATFKEMKSLVKERYPFTNITLFFEDKVKDYVIEELYLDNPNKCKKIVINGRVEGFVICHDKRIFYGCNKDIFTHEEQNNIRNGAIYYPQNISIDRINGLIPY